MKKLVSMMTAALFAAAIFVPVNLSAGVAGSALDQSYEAVSGSGSITILQKADMTQGFIPTKNRIVSVDVYLKFRDTTSNLTLKILDVNGAVLITSTHQLTAASPNTWETFSFDSPYVTVVPSNRYVLKLSDDNSGTTQWAYNSDGYTRGYFGPFPSEGSGSKDALFRVYGLDVGASNSIGSQASATNVAVASPVLTYIQKNGVKTNAPITDEITVTSADTFSIHGTAPAGSKVAIIDEDQSFDAVSSVDGSWSLAISPQLYKTGQIKAQTIQTDGKMSPLVDLFKIKVEAAPKVTVKVAAAALPFYFQPYFLIGLGVLLVLLVALLIYLERKYHGLGNMFKKKGDVKPATNPK